MSKTLVLILFGGESSEHDVSIMSAKNVISAIDNERFTVLLCYIDTSGVWRLVKNVNDTNGEQLLARFGDGGFVGEMSHQIIHPDVILPILHGKNGEDGSVQGVAQLLHIPIVGCQTTASAVGMDKVMSKVLAASANVPIVPYIVHHVGDKLLYDDVKVRLGNILFIKPNRAGSSVGVSKVYSADEFTQALELAHRHDNVVLIEKAITARELEVAVLGTLPDERVSVVGEVIPGDEFYDYNDKYSSDSTSRTNIPAEINDNVTQTVQSHAQSVYRAIGSAGLSRVDFFLSDAGDVYFNEINTLPGFTDISMYPQLWQASGVEYAELISTLIDDTIRHGRA